MPTLDVRFLFTVLFAVLLMPSFLMAQYTLGQKVCITENGTKRTAMITGLNHDRSKINSVTFMDDRKEMNPVDPNKVTIGECPASFATCKCPSGSDCDQTFFGFPGESNADIVKSDLGAFRTAIREELNKMRKDPKAYATKLRNLNWKHQKRFSNGNSTYIIESAMFANSSTTSNERLCTYYCDDADYAANKAAYVKKIKIAADALENISEELSQLTENTKLNAAADMLSDDPGKINGQAHTDSKGRNAFCRANTAGYNHRVGECLSTGFTKEAVIIGFLASPGHRKILIDPSYDEVGIGVGYHGEPNDSYIRVVIMNGDKDVNMKGDCKEDVDPEPLCPSGNVYLYSQKEVDKFVEKFPNCTKISGNLEISGEEWNHTDIHDLSGLDDLTVVGGNLYIGNNDALSDLSGLSGITYVGGSLDIYTNLVLSDLSGLSGITSIGGSLVIGNSPALSDLSGLEALTSVGGTLQISFNDVLSSLSGLDGLTFVGGYSSISYNPALSSLSGLDGLTSVGDDFYIENNDALNSLIGLDALTSVGNYLIIQSNDALSDLSGLSSIAHVGGLLIRYNPALSDLSSLVGLTSVGGTLSIDDNDALSSLSGLDGLTSIHGSLIVQENSALMSLTGLENIDASTITDMSIQFNSNLTLCAIKSICNYLELDGKKMTINNNKKDCNTRDEIKNKCGEQSAQK